MRPDLRRGWPYAYPPNVDFDINWRSPQAEGLVFWLPLLGPRGGLLERVQGRQLTPNGSPAWTADGWIGRSLLLDDTSNDWLSLSSVPVTAPPFSMTGKVCFDDVSPTEQALISLAYSSDANNYHALVMAGPLAGDPILATTKAAGIQSYAVTSTGTVANTWFTAAGVWWATDDRRAYIDGGSEGTNSTSRTPTAPDKIGVGARAASPSASYLSGKLFDVRIYDRGLTAKEVADHYLNPWELYCPRVRLWPGFVAPAAGTVVPIATLLRARRT